MSRPKQHADVTVSASFQVTKQFLSDILTSAVESNGMILSWFGDEKTNITRIAEGETWLEPLSVTRFSGRYDRKTDEEGDRGGKATIDLASVQIGLSRALVYPNLGSSYRASILRALIDSDASHVDEVCVDVIIQLAVFGEVIYG